MSQVLMKWIQKYCLQGTGYLFRKDESIYVTFPAKSSWYFKTLLHHFSKEQSRALCVVTDIHTKLPAQLQYLVV